MPRESKAVLFAGWLVLGIIWGTTWLFIKVGLRDLPPFTFAGLRFALAIVPLMVILIWRREPVPKRLGDWLLMLGTGLLTISMNYGLVFWASRTISSGQTATLHASLPLFAILFAHFMITTERMTLRRVIGVVLGILGIGFIFSQELSFEDSASMFASLGVVLAAVGMGLSNVIVKWYRADISPVLLTTVQMAFGLVPLLAIGIATEDASEFVWTPRAWLCLLYLAWVGSALAFVLMFWLIRKMPVTITQLTPFVSTVTAVLLGVIILHEPLRARFAMGAGLVLCGLIAAAIQPKARPESGSRVRLRYQHPSDKGSEIERG